MRPARRPTVERRKTTVTVTETARASVATARDDQVDSATCTRRGRSTSPTTRCRPGARRSGGSRRSSGCAACTTTRRSTASASSVEVDAARRRVIGESVGAGPRARGLVAASCRPTGSARAPGQAADARVRWSTSRPRRELDRAGPRRRSPAPASSVAIARRTSWSRAGAHARATVVLRFAGLGDAGRQRRDRRRRRRRS